MLRLIAVACIAAWAIFTEDVSAAEGTSAVNSTTLLGDPGLLADNNTTYPNTTAPSNNKDSESVFDFEFQPPSPPRVEVPPYADITSEHQLQINASFSHSSWCTELGTQVASGGSGWVAASSVSPSMPSSQNNTTRSCVHLFTIGPWREADRLSLERDAYPAEPELESGFDGFGRSVAMSPKYLAVGAVGSGVAPHLKDVVLSEPKPHEWHCSITVYSLIHTDGTAQWVRESHLWHPQWSGVPAELPPLPLLAGGEAEANTTAGKVDSYELFLAAGVIGCQLALADDFLVSTISTCHVDTGSAAIIKGFFVWKRTTSGSGPFAGGQWALFQRLDVRHHPGTALSASAMFFVAQDAANQKDAVDMFRLSSPGPSQRGAFGQLPADSLVYAEGIQQPGFGDTLAIHTHTRDTVANLEADMPEMGMMMGPGVQGQEFSSEETTVLAVGAEGAVILFQWLKGARQFIEYQRLQCPKEGMSGFGRVLAMTGGILVVAAETRDSGSDSVPDEGVFVYMRNELGVAPWALTKALRLRGSAGGVGSSGQQVAVGGTQVVVQGSGGGTYVVDLCEGITLDGTVRDWSVLTQWCMKRTSYPPAPSYPPSELDLSAVDPDDDQAQRNAEYERLMKERKGDSMDTMQYVIGGVCAVCGLGMLGAGLYKFLSSRRASKHVDLDKMNADEGTLNPL